MVIARRLAQLQRPNEGDGLRRGGVEDAGVELDDAAGQVDVGVAWATAYGREPVSLTLDWPSVTVYTVGLTMVVGRSKAPIPPPVDRPRIAGAPLVVAQGIPVWDPPPGPRSRPDRRAAGQERDGLGRPLIGQQAIPGSVTPSRLPAAPSVPLKSSAHQSSAPVK